MEGIAVPVPPRLEAPARDVVNVEEPADPPTNPVLPPYVILPGFRLCRLDPGPEWSVSPPGTPVTAVALAPPATVDGFFFAPGVEVSVTAVVPDGKFLIGWRRIPFTTPADEIALIPITDFGANPLVFTPAEDLILYAITSP